MNNNTEKTKKTSRRAFIASAIGAAIVLPIAAQAVSAKTTQDKDFKAQIWELVDFYAHGDSERRRFIRGELRRIPFRPEPRDYFANLSEALVKSFGI